MKIAPLSPSHRSVQVRCKSVSLGVISSHTVSMHTVLGYSYTSHSTRLTRLPENSLFVINIDRPSYFFKQWCHYTP